MKLFIIRALFSSGIFLALTLHAKTETRTIGALLPLTGEFASQGGAFLEGARLAAEEANITSAVKFAVKAEDTQYLSTPTLVATQKLTQDKSLLGIIISTLHEANPVMTILENKKIPSVILWDSGDEVDKAGEYIFGIGPWTNDSGKTAAEFSIKKLNSKNVAIINTVDIWSQSVSDSFEKNFKSAGGAVAGRFEIQPTEADFRSILLQVIHKNPDALYAPIDNNILSFYEQAKALKISIPIVTSDIITANLLSGPNGALEGAYQTQPQLPSSPALHYLRKNCSKFCDQLLFVGWGYDGTRALIESYKKFPDSIQEGLQSIQFEGATNTIKFAPGGSCPSKLGIYQVVHGKLEAIP